MRLSQLHALIGTALAEKWDTENVCLAMVMNIPNTRPVRLDAYGDIQLLNDVNFTNGMTYLVADYGRMP